MSLCQCQLDIACQVAQEESKLGASSAEGGINERQESWLFRETYLLLQSWCLGRLMVSDFYMVFGTSFQSEEKKETLQSLQTLNTMSWQWKMQLSHSNNMPCSE